MDTQLIQRILDASQRMFPPVQLLHHVETTARRMAWPQWQNIPLRPIVVTEGNQTRLLTAQEYSEWVNERSQLAEGPSSDSSNEGTSLSEPEW